MLFEAVTVGRRLIKANTKDISMYYYIDPPILCFKVIWTQSSSDIKLHTSHSHYPTFSCALTDPSRRTGAAMMILWDEK